MTQAQSTQTYDRDSKIQRYRVNIYDLFINVASF